MAADAPILVTGGAGQLASSLDALARSRGLAVTRVGRPDFEFDRPETIEAVFHATRPGFVVNAAAYTAVDAAESDADAAARANHTGPARLAALCAAAGVPLIHVPPCAGSVSADVVPWQMVRLPVIGCKGSFLSTENVPDDWFVHTTSGRPSRSRSPIAICLGLPPAPKSTSSASELVDMDPKIAVFR